MTQASTAGGGGRQLASILTTEAQWSPCFPEQRTFTSCVTVRRVAEFPLQPGNRLGGMRRPCGRLMRSSGISHGNPSRIPLRAGDGNAAPAGVGAWAEGGPQEPHMVSLPSCCPRNIPNHSSAQLCKLFRSAVCLCMHICCLRRLLVCTFLLGNDTLMSQYFFFSFLCLSHGHDVCSCLSPPRKVVDDSSL